MDENDDDDDCYGGSDDEKEEMKTEENLVLSLKTMKKSWKNMSWRSTLKEDSILSFDDYDD